MHGVDGDDSSAVRSTKSSRKSRHHRHRHHHGHRHREQSKGETDSGLSSSNVAGVAHGDDRKERSNRGEDSEGVSVSSLRDHGDAARASRSAQQRTGHEGPMLKSKDGKDGSTVTLTRRGTGGAAMEAMGEGSPGQDGGEGAASALSDVDDVIIGQSSKATRSVTKEKSDASEISISSLSTNAAGIGVGASARLPPTPLPPRSPIPRSGSVGSTSGRGWQDWDQEEGRLALAKSKQRKSEDLRGSDAASCEGVLSIDGISLEKSGSNPSIESLDDTVTTPSSLDRARTNLSKSIRGMAKPIVPTQKEMLSWKNSSSASDPPSSSTTDPFVHRSSAAPLGIRPSAEVLDEQGLTVPKRKSLTRIESKRIREAGKLVASTADRVLSQRHTSKSLFAKHSIEDSTTDIPSSRSWESLGSVQLARTQMRAIDSNRNYASPRMKKLRVCAAIAAFAAVCGGILLITVTPVRMTLFNTPARKAAEVPVRAHMLRDLENMHSTQNQYNKLEYSLDEYSTASDAVNHGIYIPADTDRNYGNVWDVRTQPQLPLFWHMSHSGASFVEDVLSKCLGLTMSSDTGNIQLNLNDDSTRIGIHHVITTPSLHSAKSAFEARLSRHGRPFALFRHPVQRAKYMFYNLQQDPKGDFADMTLLGFAESSMLEENYLVRLLTNEIEGPVTMSHLEVAKEIVRRKVLVGIAEFLEESIVRFEQYFGWWDMVSTTVGMMRCQHDYVVKSDVYFQQTQVIPGTEEYEEIAMKNWADIQLYDYAMMLFQEQSFLVEKVEGEHR